LPKQEKASASRSKKQLRVHTAGHRADNTASSDHDFQRLARRKNGTGGGGGDSKGNASARRRAGQADFENKQRMQASLADGDAGAEAAVTQHAAATASFGVVAMLEGEYCPCELRH
jgi:hypothetical protein